MAFTEEFSKGSHIRERSYNLIAPRVPITFEPENKEHLREIEVVNRLDAHIIHKARWIKPTTTSVIVKNTFLYFFILFLLFLYFFYFFVKK